MLPYCSCALTIALLRGLGCGVTVPWCIPWGARPPPHWTVLLLQLSASLSLQQWEQEVQSFHCWCRVETHAMGKDWLQTQALFGPNTGQCPVHSVRAGLLTAAWHPPVHGDFLLLRNASSLGEILLRKVAWMEYYKKDVYSNLKYAQIIHRGSNHPFSLPPRKKCKSHLLNKAGSEDDKILTFLKCYWRKNVTSMHNCITLLSVIFYQSKKCYTWIWGQTCLIRF